jgi:hypothetical protein
MFSPKFERVDHVVDQVANIGDDAGVVAGLYIRVLP